VLGPTYSFRITKPEIKANEVVVSFKVIQTKNEVEYERDVYTEMGGGVADVLSFLLQFIVVYLLRDRIQPILLLDEAFKHLSVEFREDMAELLRELCDRTGVQILMVTHDPIYERVADRVYRFSQPGVETLAEEIK
jgi:predicted ATPase